MYVLRILLHLNELPTNEFPTSVDEYTESKFDEDMSVGAGYTRFESGSGTIRRGSELDLRCAYGPRSTWKLNETVLEFFQQLGATRIISNVIPLDHNSGNATPTNQTPPSEPILT